MSAPTHVSTMHHLTLDISHKIDQLSIVLENLKKQRNEKFLTKVVILTNCYIAEDLSVYLNKVGFKAASITSEKSQEEIEKLSRSFNNQITGILVTDKLKDINVWVDDIINFNMFVPNCLWFERNKSDDVFHNE
jgi:superfamily II DNA/RNA helicase